MSISNKKNIFYLLVALIVQEVIAWDLGDSPPDLCKEKDRNDFDLTLRASMLFRNALILIDKNWFVYTLHNFNSNQSYSHLIGQPLEEYWPAFKEYPPWKDIKPNVVSIYHVDIKTPFLYMDAHGMEGVCYNLNTSTFCGSGQPLADDDLVQPIITDNGSTQFSINMDDDYCIFCKENQTIDQTECEHKCVILWNGNLTWLDDGRQSDSTYFPMGYMYYTWNRTDRAVKNITVIDERATNPSEYISPDFELENLDWHLPQGFLYDGYFNFLDQKNVYSFPISPLKLVDYPSEPKIHATHPLIITKVKDYFSCVHLNSSGHSYLTRGYSLN